MTEFFPFDFPPFVIPRRFLLHRFFVFLIIEIFRPTPDVRIPSRVIRPRYGSLKPRNFKFKFCARICESDLKMKDFKYASLKLFIFVYERVTLSLLIEIIDYLVSYFYFFFLNSKLEDWVSFISLWVSDLLIGKVCILQWLKLFM